MKKIKAAMAGILTAIFILGGSGTVVFANFDPPKEKAVVFVLDASGSMKTNDPERLALDSIAQLIYSLPSEYRVGIVAYNTGIALQTALGESAERQSLVRQATEVKYQGYTGAGQGLQTALSLSEDTGIAQTDMILLSDGEILLQKQDDTQQEITLFESQVQRAKEMGTVIHVIGLGEEMEDTSSDIFGAATKTGGSQHHVPDAQDIQKAIDSILSGQLGVHKSSLGVMDSDGTPRQIEVNLPASGMSRVRVLLIGSKPITNMTASFTAENSLQDSGKRYAFLDLHYPTVDSLKMTVDSEPGSKIKVEVITEYNAVLEAEVVYEDLEPAHKQAEQYERTATVTLSFTDANNPSKKLFTDDYFNGTAIKANIQGKPVDLLWHNGQGIWTTRVLKQQEVSIGIDQMGFPTNVSGEHTALILLEEPPVFIRPSDTPFFIGSIGLLLAALAAVIIIILYRRKQAVTPPLIEVPVPGKYCYTGKLNLYVTQTRSGIDIPPLTFNLFRLSSGRSISLAEILEELKAEELPEGAEKLFFSPSDNRRLLLSNQSDCTILKSRELLMKGKSIQLEPDEKVDIAFEDKCSELVLQYKEV